jgi:hypothetical protein
MISTIMYKVAVYAPAERQIHIPLFLLYSYMYSVSTTTVLGSSLVVLHWKAIHILST